MQVLDERVLIENKRLREAAEDFVRQNPWAFEFVPSEDLKDIIVFLK